MASRLNASDKNSDSVRKRIEKHTFEDEEGEEYSGSKFGGFGEYFRRKKIKLQNLDAELRSSAVDNPNIFRGVVAHVNGYTQPSLNDLHHMIVSHGGGFMQYLDGKTTVTHIIASNLTPKKCVEFRRYRIVKPAWVVDSIKAGKLLAWNAYRVVDEGKAQNLLNIENGRVESQANQQAQGYKDQTSRSWYTAQLNKEDVESPAGASVLHQTKSDEDLLAVDDQKQQEKQLLNQTQPQALYEDYEFSSGGLGSLAENDGNTKEELPENTTNSEAVVLLEDDNRNADTGPQRELTAEEHNKLLLSDPRLRKSSVLNPAFLQQYYAESRLHHLSAWKAEIKAKVQKLAAERSLTQKARQRRPAGSRRYILHVDFDSFFAAVSLLKQPDLVTQPVVVAHGSGPGSEIASCNYPARAFGIKNGMWMKRALELCSDIKVLPYDYESYEKASHGFYSAILETDGVVQSVSVDEALVDISVDCWKAGKDGGHNTIAQEETKADDIASGLRKSIKDITGCEVSIGIGNNILLAKLALRKAKPAGQFHLKPKEIFDFLGPLPVQSLPGIAHNLGGKLEELGVKVVSDLRGLSEGRLTGTLGPKTGRKLWEYARGIDHAEIGDQVIRKSVSAEVNWGVRFETQPQAEEFVQSLSTELSRRLLNEGVKGKHLTMKILRRAADAPLDPPKHLGHGKVDTYNKSVSLGVASNSPEMITKESLTILKKFNFSPGELRGLGLQMTKLETIKSTSGALTDGSQKRLQFKTTPVKRSNEEARMSPLDEIESPSTSRVIGKEAAAPATVKVAEVGQRTTSLLNTSGTQFILPTQVDAQILAELPKDILSRLRQPSKRGSKSVTSNTSSRSGSPTPAGNAPPPQSQLDPETLAALPPDIRAEVLSFYSRNAAPPAGLTTHSNVSTSPRTKAKVQSRSASAPNPRSKRLGRPTKASKSTNIKGSIQSNFAKVQTSRPQSPSKENISEDFLAALPPDIRAEVQAAQKVTALSRSSLILPTTPKALRSKFETSKDTLPPQPNFIRPMQPAPRPTFSVRKLWKLSDLLDAVKAWAVEFLDEGPHKDDVEALSDYLEQVVVDERDMEKAVRIVKWLAWNVEVRLEVWERDGYVEGMNRFGNWSEAITSVRESIQKGLVKRRIYGRIDFDA